VNRAPRRPLARVGYFLIDQCLVLASIAFVIVVVNGALALTGSAQ
jgi:hypothetical protein